MTARRTPSPRRPSRGTRARLAAALIATVLALTACSAALPTTSSPRTGLPVSVQAQQDIERFLAPPQPGASTAEIVRGFLRANVGFADSTDVARAYLTDDLASRWVPTQDVLVYEGTPEVAPGAADQVIADVQVAGRIDAGGRLTEEPSGTTLSQPFELRQVEGEWRISAFPEGFGLWLSRSDLENSFGPTFIHHLNPHAPYFVPELLWLARGEGRPTSVVRSQLAPPPDHLEGAVRTGATEEIRLAVPSVPVDTTTNVATVNLRGSGLADGSPAAVDLQSQLSQSLLGLTGVTGVDVQVSGQSLSLVGQEGPITATTPLPYTSVSREADLALLRVGERFTPVDPTIYDLRDLPSDAVGDLELPRLGMSWTGVSATEDLQDFAAVSTDRTSLWRWQDGRTHTNEGIGDELTAPAVDPQGAFWVGGINRSTGGPRLWVVERDKLISVARPIDVEWLGPQDRVRSVSISPDGSRAVLVLGEESGERGRVVMAGILRDGDGQATGMSQPLGVAPGMVEVTTAHWASASEILMVGRRAEDQRARAFSLHIGEWLQPLGIQDGTADVIAVPTGSGSVPIIRTVDGRFHTPEGQSGWYEARNGDELVIPGS